MNPAQKIAAEIAAEIDENIELALYKYDDTIATIKRIIAAKIESVVPQWIPCSERMPEWGEPILFYDGKRTHCGWRSAITGAWHSATAETAFHETAVTHWQPLPQPPEATT